MIIPEKLKSLKPYDPAELQPRFKLDANESFIDPPDYILRSISASVGSVDLKRYPDPCAKELCAEAASFYGVPEDCIVASNGSDEMISIIFNCFLNKGDTMLVSEPDFSMYRFYAHLAEARVITSEKICLTADPSDIKRLAFSGNASLVIFSNPCNPTGTGLKRKDVLELVSKLDCLAVIDEAYMEFWDESIVADVINLPNVIVLKTCSKALGIAGVRLGFAIGNKNIIDLIKKSKSPFNVNSLTQAAGRALLREREYIKKCVSRIKASRDILARELGKTAADYPGSFEVFKTVANFVLLKSDIAEKLYTALLEKGILVRRVMGDYLRITAGSDEENEAVAECILELLKKEGNDG